ncbi:TerD family protein [Streptomyces litchfieldiae]|uniref:TerD family protein n=1 Tax=Streptomyces litchfieldiae TaxID=3075543 RepID=A0ABU2MT70_9ACTN|nr:TerD family protein [Streptomyces sp. DSM 44938]MDT0344730.1 TerD family protein [Streptomyces sp. DSM 44938]
MAVNLVRGQTIGLGGPDGAGPSTIRMGLGWKSVRHGFLGTLLRGGRDLDLDASALLFAGDHAEDVVYFRKLTSDDGSVVHSGDSLTGSRGQEDDEAIVVDLRRVPPRIDQVVFTVSSFMGQRFSDVRNAFCRLVDESTGVELARYTLAGGGDSTAQIMAKVRRQDAGWQMTAIGAPATGRTFQDLLSAIRPHL